MKRLNTISTLVFTGLVALLFSPTVTFAANDTLPNIMVGQTKLIQNGKTYLGGLTGNYAILNNTSTPDLGFNNNPKYLTGCQKPDGTIILPTIATTACFVLSNKSKTNMDIKLLSSRTKVKIGTREIQTILEAPALYYGVTNTIIGDAFGKIDYDKFSFWGNSSSSSGSSAWTTDGYAINPNSQSSWMKPDNTQSAAYKTYYDKLRALASNGATLNQGKLNVTGNMPIYLQSSDIYSQVLPAVDEAALYPEGKIWVVDGDLRLSNPDRTIFYYGVGTIIVKGNIDIASGIKIEPVNNQSKLGIMSIAGD